MLKLIAILVLAIPAMFFWMIVSDPHNLYDLMRGSAQRRQRKSDEANRIQAEIDRKCAIADQAIAARARGETYIPPSDYDR